jgi:hypothetical protein
MISAPNMPFDVMLSLDRAPRSTRIARICSLSRCSQKVTKQIQWRLRLTTPPARRAEYAMVQSDGEKVRVSACHKLQYLLIGTSLDSYTRCLSRSSAWIRSQLSA